MDWFGMEDVLREASKGLLRIYNVHLSWVKSFIDRKEDTNKV